MDSGSIAYSFRHPAHLLKALRLRWPNPIQATVRVGGPFNELPRLPFQLWECVLRTAHFLTQVPTLIRERAFRPVRGSGTAPAATGGEKGRTGSRSRKAGCLMRHPRSPDDQSTPPEILLPAPIFGCRGPLTPPFTSFKFPSLSIGGADASAPPGRLALSGAFFWLYEPGLVCRPSTNSFARDAARFRRRTSPLRCRRVLKKEASAHGCTRPLPRSRIRL